MRKRPVIRIPITEREIALEMFAAVGAALSVFITIMYWPILPETIPTHFGVSGRPDAWGPKNSFLLLPVVILGIYALLSVVSRFPHYFNYPVPITEENAPRLYAHARLMMYWVKAQSVWLMVYIHWGTARVAIGRADGLNPTVMAAMLLVLIGTMIWSIRQSLRNR